MTRFGYVRTSTADQPGNGQLHLLREAGIPDANVYFDEGVSGMKADRPRWNELRGLLKAGDEVTVSELSRIGRSVKNVLAIMEEFEAADIGLVILDLHLDTRSPVGRMTLTVLAAVSRLERDMISERTKAAMAALKADGKQVGRVRTITPKQVKTARRLRDRGMSVPDIAADMQVPKSSLYRYLAAEE